MNPKTIISLSAIVVAFTWRAETQNADTNFFPLLCCSNRTYTNATIETVTPATVTIFFDGGGAQVPFTNLPPELQTRYHYDPVEAEKYLAAQAAKKTAMHEQDNRTLAAIALAKQTLGPAQKVRLVKILPDTYVQIEVDGVLSEAFITKLPPDILPLLRELGSAEADVASLRDQLGLAQPGSVQRGSRFRESRSAARNEASAAVANAIDRSNLQTSLERAMKHLDLLKAKFRLRSMVIARPSGYFVYGHTRQWEFQAMANAGTPPR